MGLFDFLRRRPTPPADLRDALFRAADRQDWQALAALCQQNRRDILASFPLWRTVPEAIRTDHAAQNRYCQGLLAVAQTFDQAGDRSLLARLVGDEADNPISAWQRDLAAAQSLINEGQPAEAVKLLQSVIANNAGLSGSGVTHYLPRTYGMLGVAQFRTGDRAKAVEFTQKAKALCEQSGDQEGIAIYEANLRHMEEGGTVIFRGGDGRVLTLEEVRGLTGTFRYEVIGAAGVPPRSRVAAQAGPAGRWIGRL